MKGCQKLYVFVFAVVLAVHLENVACSYRLDLSSIHHVISRRQTEDDDPCPLPNIVDDYLQQATGISPECAKKINSTRIDDYSFVEEVRYWFCDPICSPQFIDYWILRKCGRVNETQDDTLDLVELYVLSFCGINNGVSCLSILASNDSDLESSSDTALSVVCNFGSNDFQSCTPQCSDRLNNYQTNVGCCINNYYGGLARYIDGLYGTNSRNRFGDDGIWDGCGLENPGYCPVNPVLRQFISPDLMVGTIFTPKPTVPGPNNPGDAAVMIGFDKFLFFIITLSLVEATVW